MADPWLKFYPTDWRADPALRMCSLAARGLWIEMLGIMHDAAQYGHLLIANRAPNDAQLAVLIGTTPAQITELLGELEAAAVFSRTRKGVIYSRRMVRDAKKAETARKNGKKGGNPSLSKSRENSASDNRKDKGGDKPQKPEARSQIDDDDDSARPDRGFIEQVCEAAGARFGEPTPSGVVLGLGQGEADAVRRWQTDLKLSPNEILTEVRRQAARRRAPPNSLTYFTKGLQALAGQKSAPPLTPIAPPEGASDVSPARTNRQAAASDALRYQLDVAGRMRRPSNEDCF